MTREHPRDVGQALRQSVEQAMKADRSSRDMKVFAAALWSTAGWGKLLDRVAVAQIAAVVYSVDVDDVQGWQRDRVSKSLRRLCDSGVLGYEPGRGRVSQARVWLPPAVNPVHSKPGLPAEIQSHADRVSDGNTGSSGSSLPRETRAGSARNTGRVRAKPSHTGGHTGFDSGYFSGFEPSPNARGRTRGQTAKPESPPDPLYNRIRSIWPDTWPATIHTTLDELRHGHNIADHLIDAAIGQAEQRHMNDPVNNPCRYIERVATDWYQQRVSA